MTVALTAEDHDCSSGPSREQQGPFLFPFPKFSDSSTASTSSSTPLPSRSTSPLPQFYFDQEDSSPSDDDTDPTSFLRGSSRSPSADWCETRQSWWGIPPLRRRRSRRFVRCLRKWFRRLVRHPFFPSQPITIVLTLLLLTLFAVSLTLLLIYILNPDKEPLPWQAYCSAPAPALSHDSLPTPSTPMFPYVGNSTVAPPPPFPPPDLADFPPAGLFVGVFSIDSGFERRMLIRDTWAKHPRSRDGACGGDSGVGTSRTIVRFIMGLPRRDWERRIQLEMEMYHDIVILPMAENMNGGKTHTFFSWAYIHAWVPPVYTSHARLPPSLSYSNYSSPPPPLAPHDSSYAWQDYHSGKHASWVRPDYVMKVDDDAFVMLAEVEARLRVELHALPLTPPVPPLQQLAKNYSEGDNVLIYQQSNLLINPNDPLIYWGYLVTNRLHKFMAGELYALSWSLVEWVANDPAVKGITKGAEDKQTAKWMKMHPRASEVRWASERCWIYDHPRAGTVYAHGFLYPSEATRVKERLNASLKKTQFFSTQLSSPEGDFIPSTPSAWAQSSVSTFGARYSPPVPDLSPPYSVEALVEGSDMSMVRQGSPMTPEYAWTHRAGRTKRYEGKHVGGTVAVHFIKKNMWFLETALAFLEGEEYSEAEKFQRDESRQHSTTVQYTPPV